MSDLHGVHAGGTSRRAVLKGAGLAGAGLATLGTLGQSSAAAAPGRPGISTNAGDPNLGVFLRLTLDGTVVAGDSQVRTHEYEIECIYLSLPAAASTKKGLFGDRAYEPLVLRKRVDPATPLLYRGLAAKQTAAGRITVRREGSMPIDLLTIEFDAARLVAVASYLPEQTPGADDAIVPMLEEVAVVFSTITITYNVQRPDGTLGTPVTFTDSWSPPLV